MTVHDLWYLSTKRDAKGKKLPSKRHGRGKRWRVSWEDPETGRTRNKHFDGKTEAERYDSNVMADISRGQYVDPVAGQVKVEEYSEQWCENQIWREATRQRVDSQARHHIIPVLGHRPMVAIRHSTIQSWVKDRSQRLAPSTLGVIFHGHLAPMFATAVVDRIIGMNPCTGIRLPNPSKTDYFIPTEDQVLALSEKLPKEYRAIPILAAGCGWRSGEILGCELDAVQFLKRDIIMRQQLKDVSGEKPFLAEPKSDSGYRTNDLPDIVGTFLSEHIASFPPKPVLIWDKTDPRNPVQREALLLFTNRTGKPFYRNEWSKIWVPAVAAAGLPKGFGLHGLRHYHATQLIFGGANVVEVQMALGHASATTTLRVYVHWWPGAKTTSIRSIVDGGLGAALSARSARKAAGV